MQIQTDQIKRPRLIEPFLHLELTPTNDFVEYIDTTSADNNVTSLQNNSIYKLLSSKFICDPDTVSLSFAIKKGFKECQQIVNLRNIIKNPQQRNNALSFV
jgi:hypothetical protein